MERLLRIMVALRDPRTGCPWDREQTYRSIVPHTLEEAYEVADAIERGDIQALPDELGDLLFQVVFYAQIGREAGDFTFDDVVTAIADKIVRRHPHVFGDEHMPDSGTQSRSWEAIKAAERAKRADGSERTSALDDVPITLPALQRAVKLQKHAGRVGFDWSASDPVVDKVREELGELEAELRKASPERSSLADELGDVLFACANLARHLGVDAEAALRGTNAKFERRFRGLEDALRARGVEPADADFETLEAAYQEVKGREG